jgi:anti-sigma factor RsiW
LPEDERARFEAHLERCAGCVRYVEQIRETVRLARSIRDEEVPQALLDALRNF